MNSGSKATHTWDELTSGVPLATGKRHTVVVPSQELIVRFETDPAANPQIQEERFTLIGGQTKDAPAYQQTKTGKDDLVKGDAYLDLRFTDLVPDVMYWLEVDPGDGRPTYLAFESVPWSEIRQW
jgi:hypothetical protein